MTAVVPVDIRVPAELGTWVERAVCRTTDPEMWFPPPRPGEDRRHARARWDRELEILRGVCRSCPVQAECLDYAVRTKAVGVWGGTTDSERGGLPVRPCDWCGAGFSPRRRTARFCSDTCREKRRWAQRGAA